MLLAGAKNGVPCASDKILFGFEFLKAKHESNQNVKILLQFEYTRTKIVYKK